MPYIITTKRRSEADVVVHGPLMHVVSRRAFATLQEAREQVWRSISSDTLADVHPIGSMGDTIANLPELGGTIGPLPDGTVIAVKPALLSTIAWQAGLFGTNKTMAEIIDAFNARQR